MNWGQFKDPVCHMCLAGTVVASWSLMQEMAGSSPFTVINIFITMNGCDWPILVGNDDRIVLNILFDL